MLFIIRFEEKDARSLSYLIKKTLYKINRKFYPRSVIKFMSNEYSPQSLINISKERDFIVVTFKDKIVGCASMFHDYIGTVFVHPKYINRGFGTLLMKHMEEIAIKNKIETIRGNASINSVNFYTNLGYINEGIVLHTNYGMTYKMTKKLIK